MSEEALRRIAKEKEERTGVLDLSDCQLTEVPEELRDLTWLIILEMSSNLNLASLKYIDSLYNLELLNCSNTNIKDLSLLKNLITLKTLYINRTNVSDLGALHKLTGLKSLSCNYTNIYDLTPLQDLFNLQILSVIHTNIRNLNPLKKLNNLKYIDITNTKVNDISGVTHLLNTSFDIEYEENIKNTETVICLNCPITTPPIEFIKKGKEAVLEYFSQLDNYHRPLNELKIIFLGEGAVGKTSLIKCIRNENFNPNESQTHGITILQTLFSINEQTTNAHLWDFGGQEVMHATHQFFLSQRCIYVLVLDSRKDEKAEYWLKHANSFGGNSPVLVVLNKTDENPSFEVNRKVLNEKYPQIKGYYKLSCKTDEGITEFISALKKEISQAPARRTPFPSTWLTVKEHFANMKQDYIDSCEYHAICLKHGVDKPFSQSVLLQFLHDLGLVINFKNLKAFDTQILNPIWLTNGVYRIINSKMIVDNKGIVHENDLDNVINDPHYQSDNTSDKPFHCPKDKLLYIIRVMQEFELCFPLTNQTYVIPQLLPVNEPDFHFNGSVIYFTIDFPELLPDSIFPRLMVKLHDFIKDGLRWRTGMVLSKPIIFKAEARVRIDREDKRIKIDVCGAEPRRLLSFIRETLKEIIDDFLGLKFSENIILPNTDIALSYSKLIGYERMGDTTVSVPELDKRFLISDLLNGVEEPQMRDEVAQTPVKAFVSYAKKDAKYLLNLQSAFSPLKRLNKLQLWTDLHINVGTDREQTIMQQLKEADIVICLISADFIGSDFCYTHEFEKALEGHKVGTKTIFPVRLRTCNYEGLDLAKIQGTPSNWITSSTNQDEAWTEVAKSLTKVIETTQQRLNTRAKLTFN